MQEYQLQHENQNRRANPEEICTFVYKQCSLSKDKKTFENYCSKKGSNCRWINYMSLLEAISEESSEGEK